MNINKPIIEYEPFGINIILKPIPQTEADGGLTNEKIHLD
jgi:hypothetical protein